MRGCERCDERGGEGDEFAWLRKEGRFVLIVSHHMTLSLTFGSFEDSIAHVLSFYLSPISCGLTYNVVQSRILFQLPTPFMLILLTDQDTPVPHLAVAKCLHRVLNALAI